jgi:autotransporter-associated beta strand protein
MQTPALGAWAAPRSPTLIGSDSLIKQGPGTLVLSAANLHTGGTIVEEGTLVVRNLSALGQGGVEVRAGAKLVLDGGGGRFTVPSLTLDPAGRIDVGMSQLSIRSGFSRAALLAAINAAKGDDGTWNGDSGIGSSVVEAMAPEGTHRTLGWLGWVDNGDASVTVGFAAPGDTNLDGSVDMIDLGNFIHHMDGDPAEAMIWNAGDFNHDDAVDFVDFAEFVGAGLFDEGNYLPAPPPATPGNLQATSATTSSIMLSWTATDTPAGYEIERSADGVGDWRPVAPDATQISGTSATRAGLEPGERAFFRLRAFAESPSWWWDDRYRSADTAAVAATAIPSAPANVRARGVTPTQAVISWVPGPGRSTGTVIQRRAQSESEWVDVETAVSDGQSNPSWVDVAAVASDRRFVIDTGLVPGETYVYRVQSVSDTASSVPVSPPGPVTMPTEEPTSDADQDGDGLPDIVELKLVSNPDATDSDGDGVGDGEEFDRGSDPANPSDGGTPPKLDTEVTVWRDHCNVADIPVLSGRGRTEVLLLPAGVRLPAKLLVTYSEASDDEISVNGQSLPRGGVYAVVDAASRSVVVTATSTDTSITAHYEGWVSCQLLVTDIDVDSDNNNHLEPPLRSPEEEQIEDSKPKKVVVNSTNKDDDIPDYADWWVGGKSFTPVVVQIPDAIPVAEMTVTFDYAASDPDEVSVIPPYALPENGGPIRLWAKNASDVRSPLSMPQHLLPSGAKYPGDFVKPGVEYDASALGFSQSARTIVFYVEGVRLSKDPNLIKFEVKANGMVLGKDAVTVSVISNFLVIGIDGTDQSKWLNGPNATRPNGLWNSHVRNLLDDVEPYAMTIYNIGPTQAGFDCAEIQTSIVNEANRYIEEAGGDTIVALVGWSRGAMIALWAANDLVRKLGQPQPTAARQVAFVGLYDPVDMSTDIPDENWDPDSNGTGWGYGAGGVQSGIGRVTIVGGQERGNDRAVDNVDYPVGWPNPFSGDITFHRMAWGDRISPLDGATVVERTLLNASHGSIGGTPGYNSHLVSPPNGGYVYATDRENSIQSDWLIRTGMRASGFSFVPDRDPDWYGIPKARPVTLE